MFKLFLFFALLFLLIISKSTFAADGCIADVPLQTSGKLFTELYASNVNEFDAYGSSVTNPNTVYCIRTRTGSCTVRGYLGNYTGTPVTYSLPVGCPIDDYADVLVFISGAVAITSLFKKKFNPLLSLTLCTS